MTAKHSGTAVSFLLLALGGAHCFLAPSTTHSCFHSSSLNQAFDFHDATGSSTVTQDLTEWYEQDKHEDPSSERLSLQDTPKKKEDKYWFDQRIHTVGNIGIGGGFHAWIAPFATRQIDKLAYGGLNLRLAAAKELNQTLHNHKARVLDMCCGVGMSTRALCEAFPDAIKIVGLDTSPHMLAMANFIDSHVSMLKHLYDIFRKGLDHMVSHSSRERWQEWWEQLLKQGGASTTPGVFQDKSFVKANAQDTKMPSMSYDLITIMYAFHETPHHGRGSILHEARRLLSPGGLLAVVDISTDYVPPRSMLSGEPFVLEYQQNIHCQLREAKGFAFEEYKTMVPGHVGMWTLRRQEG